jgi:hypothetical protein
MLMVSWQKKNASHLRLKGARIRRVLVNRAPFISPISKGAAFFNHRAWILHKCRLCECLVTRVFKKKCPTFVFYRYVFF